MKAKLHKKYQSGGRLDTIGLRKNLNKTGSTVDSLAKAKVSSGTKVWTSEEKASYRKKKVR